MVILRNALVLLALTGAWHSFSPTLQAEDDKPKAAESKQAGEKKPKAAKKESKKAAEAKSEKAKRKSSDKKAADKKSNDKQNADKKSDKQKEDEKPKAKLRQINLAGNYVDLIQPVSFDPLSMALGGGTVRQRSFFKLIKFLDDMQDDKRYAYLLLDLSSGSLSMNPAQLDELARHLRDLRRSGKRIFAWLEDASNVHLAIAANCDHVLMADMATVDMPSMSMQTMFYRDAMDLVGVKASVVRAGDFKGAVEPYVNAKMSDHLRAHYLEMVEALNESQVDRVARGRGLKPADVRRLQGQRIVLAKEALQAGLVDELAAYGAMRKAVQQSIDEPIEWVTPKAAAKKQVSMFQLMGQMMAGPAGSGGRLRDNSLVVLHLSGQIVNGKKAAGGRIVDGPTVSLIDKLIEEEKVKGVVVRINSPGGSATASESIRQALSRLAKAKPTVISMGNMAASGGYWISCIDAPVYAERGTVTGSIGVFSMKLSAGALMRRVGVRLESVTLDDSAAAFNLDRAWSEQDQANLQSSVDAIYRRFLKLVSKSRGIKLKKLERLAGGRVWSGSQAKRQRLVDHLGGVDDCLELVAKRADLDDYHVVHRPLARSGLDLSELLSSGGEDQILGRELWSALPSMTWRVLKQRGLQLRQSALLLHEALTNQGTPTTWLMPAQEFSLQF